MLKLSIALIGIVLLVFISTLLLNDARLMQPPGPLERLSVYFTRNSAQTTNDHTFPELRTPVYHATGEELFLALQDAALDLGWNVVNSDLDSLQMELMVETPMLRFKDDVYVQIRPQGCKDGVTLSEMQVRSHSRVGSGDLAANAGHIQKLIARVQTHIDAYRSEEQSTATGTGDTQDRSLSRL